VKMQKNEINNPFRDIPLFAFEFVQHMREHHEVPDQLKPTLRQAIAIPQWLSVVYMQKGKITTSDLIEGAVITSYFEIQDIAKRVAIEILFFGNSSRQDKSKRPEISRKESDLNENAQIELSSTIPQSVESKNGQPILSDLASHLIEKIQALFSLSTSTEHQPVRASVKMSHEGMNQEYRKHTDEKQEVSKGTVGLGVGSGEMTALKTAFFSRKGISLRLRSQLKQYAREILNNISDLRRAYEDIEGEILRNYQYGDDWGAIDFEETLECILEENKPLDQVTYEDFFIRLKRRIRHRAVVLLLDISESMEGRSLDLLKLCSATLLYCFPVKEVAIAFFESDTYIIKEILQKDNIDNLVDNIITTNCLMGTMSSNVLKWTYQQLTNPDLARSGIYDKFCIIFSDACFFDVDVALHEIDQLQSVGVKVCIVMPSFAPTAAIAEGMEKNSELFKKQGCFIIKVGNIGQFISSIIKIFIPQ